MLKIDATLLNELMISKGVKLGGYDSNIEICQHILHIYNDLFQSEYELNYQTLKGLSDQFKVMGDYMLLRKAHEFGEANTPKEAFDILQNNLECGIFKLSDGKYFAMVD